MLFDRKVRVLIGPKGAESIIFSEAFKISFTVSKSLKEDINTIEVSIYNLSKESRNRIFRENQRLILIVGYGNVLETLAIGDIIRTNVVYDLPDIRMDIQAGDGAAIVDNVEFSFDGVQGVDFLIEQVVAPLGIPIRNTGVEINGEYQNGASFSGPIKDTLTQLTKKAGLNWSIQDGELQLLKPGQAMEGRGVRLSPTSGMLKSPQQLDTNEDSADVVQGAGYKVASLLNPKIRPGERIKIESREVVGTFQAVYIEHKGDTHGNEWTTEAEVYEES